MKRLNNSIIFIMLALLISTNACYALGSKSNEKENTSTIKTEDTAKVADSTKSETHFWQAWDEKFDKINPKHIKLKKDIQNQNSTIQKEVNNIVTTTQDTSATVEKSTSKDKKAEEKKTTDILEGSTSLDEKKTTNIQEELPNTEEKATTKEKTNTVAKKKKKENNKVKKAESNTESSPFFNEKSIEEVRKEIIKKPETEAPKIYTNNVHSEFTLEDCIKIAITYNPKVRSTIYNAQVYKTKIGQAWANYFPVISAGITAAREGSHAGYSTGDVSLYNTLGYLPSVSGEMLLFDFGKTKATADSAKRTFEAKKADTEENINVIVYGLKKAYYNVLFGQAQVKVYEDTVKDYELQKTRALSFYQIGKKAKIDVITAEYNLGKAKLNLVKAKNTLEIANAELSKVMGIPSYTNYTLTSKFRTNKFDLEQEDAINKAFEVRPELLSAQKAHEAAKLNLRAKRRTLAPDLGMYGAYNNGRGNEFNSYSYQLGVGLNYNEFNIAKVKKQIDEAKATYKKSEADYEAIKQNIYLNVKKAYLDLRTAEEAITIAKLALDQAKEQYRQADGRYRAGVGDIIELKDAETTYLSARLDFYNSLLNYNTYAANLEKEIGIPLNASQATVLPSTNMNDY